jgi:hypothetical protein
VLITAKNNAKTNNGKAIGELTEIGNKFTIEWQKGACK